MPTSPELFPVILRTIVGSQAHGVADANSDYDYREVFVAPTIHLLSVPRANRPKTAWQSEHRMTDDEGGWEIEPFIEMCLRCHPNAIEVLAAPIDPDSVVTEEGKELRALLPEFLSARAAAGSMLGYAKNARGKMLDREQLARHPKWAATYLRVLWQGQHLQKTGELVVNLQGTPVYEDVVAARGGWLPAHRVLEITDPWEDYLNEIRIGKGTSVLPKEPNTQVVNDWLLRLRKDWWDVGAVR